MVSPGLRSPRSCWQVGFCWGTYGAMQCADPRNILVGYGWFYHLMGFASQVLGVFLSSYPTNIEPIKMLLQQELPNRKPVFSWVHLKLQGHRTPQRNLRPSPNSSAAQASILLTKVSARQQRRMTWRSAERSSVPSRCLANSCHSSPSVFLNMV